MMENIINSIDFKGFLLMFSDNFYEISLLGIVLLLVLGFVVGSFISSFKATRRIRAIYKNIQKSSIESKEEKIPDPFQPKETTTAEEMTLEDKIWYKEEISFIFKLIEDISLSLNKEEIAYNIIEKVGSFIPVQRCVLVLIDEYSGKLKIKAARGISEDIVKNTALKQGESISGWVMGKDEPVIINNFQEQSWFKEINKEPYLDNSFISVPLSLENEVFGVLHVCEKKTGEEFQQEDLQFLVNVSRVAAIGLKNISLHAQMQDSYLKTITALASALDARDPYTKCHSENVTRYSVMIARALNLSLAEIEKLKRAGLLHDIGKIGIRDEILLKPGKLTAQEFEQIKAHPAKGETIIKSLPFLGEIPIWVRHHHERFDGKGYPDGIEGERIELGARILAIADTFDAMTSDRPYRKALSLEVTVEEIKRNKGSQFDPEIADCFLKIIEQNPKILQQT